MSILDKVLDYLMETDYRALPQDVVEATRRQVLDTLGVTVAGTTCSIAGEMAGLAAMVKGWGGKEESTILGFGGRVPAPSASFINGVSSVRLDYDDTLVTWVNLHCSRAIVPAVFAVAEAKGNVSGRELIAAIALGYDLSCRVKQACGRNADNAIRFTSNFFGAAAAAGKVLGLDREQMRSALFLAFHQMSGAGSAGGGGLRAGAGLKGVSNGFAARDGVIGAYMAQKGFIGAGDFLEPDNKENYYTLYCGGAYLPWILTLDLGKNYAARQTSLKEFPCCHGQHASIEAALALMKEHKLKASDIAQIDLHLSQSDFHILADPVERKQNPENIIEIQFSVCWGVASAVVYGEVGLKNFSAEALGDKRIRAMARRVMPRVDAAMNVAQGFPPATADIRTKDGKVYSKKVSDPYGTVGNPMSFADIKAKFRDCCRHSAGPISEQNQDKVISLVEGLEDIKDAGRIAGLLG